MSLQKAKAYFAGENSPQTISARRGEDEDFTRIVKWEYAYEYTGFLKRQIVVVPIVHTRNGIPSGNKQLWLYEDEDGGNHAMVAEYIHDKIDTSVPLTDQFSGLLLLKTWDDQVLGGFQIKKDQVINYVTDLKFNKELTTNPGGRRRVEDPPVQCYEATTCRPLRVDLFYNGAWGGFYTTSCHDRIICIYQDFPGQQGSTIAPHWIPITPIGSGAGGAPSMPPGFDIYPNDYKRETWTNPCIGLSRMWQIGYRGNDPILTKEVSGFLTSDNKIIIAPTATNTATKAHFSESYYDSQGRMIISFEWENHKLTTFDRDLGLSTEYYVIGSIHTHPYLNSPNYLDGVASPEDRALAGSGMLAGYRNFILNDNGLVEYRTSTSPNVSVSLIEYDSNGNKATSYTIPCPNN